MGPQGHDQGLLLGGQSIPRFFALPKGHSSILGDCKSNILSRLSTNVMIMMMIILTMMMMVMIIMTRMMIIKIMIMMMIIMVKSLVKYSEETLHQGLWVLYSDVLVDLKHL